ncbi:hypothetical protein DAI01_14240 [Sphingomonas koreensis]|uniref:hypothetical protein n=1 Tax=Sphingomonas koreensis TaxID=93064 RepID=UPI000F7EFE43|nr:hypothetical protein [Sphingomonas koreensis]RSX05225.1 hypothetical protein DAI01_14240 [Sphingomonas koreensis]
MSDGESGSPSAKKSLSWLRARKTENPAALSHRLAIWHAMRSKPIDFYPRVANPGAANATLDSAAIIAEFADATPHWPKIEGEDLEDAIKLARQSLDEAKDQTEYQDQKATRLLTVTTFLTALSGVIFTRYNDRYALEAVWHSNWFEILAVLVGYALFGVFLLASLGGALVTFHATRTRFKYPGQEKVARDDGDPKSRLFHTGMLAVRPRAWATAFVAAPALTAGGTPDASKVTLRAALQQNYFRDLVGEAYLVSAKAADKLRYLEPAQGLLSLALKCLLAWLILLPVIIFFVPAKHMPDTPKTTKLIVPNPLPVNARITALPPPPPAPAPPPSPPAAIASPTAGARATERLPGPPGRQDAKDGKRTGSGERKQ